MKNSIPTLAIRALLIMAMVFTCAAGFAQDAHYSQYFNAPFTQNPALTGMMKSDWRAGAIYRKQWTSIQYPYATFSAHADYNKLFYKSFIDKWGVGVAFTNDNLGLGTLVNNSVIVASAIRIPINKKGTHLLSLGAQGGISSRALNNDKFLFGNQLNSEIFDFDRNIASGESFNTTALAPLLNGGAMYTYVQNQDIQYNIGVSAYNLLPVKDKFTNAITSNTNINRGQITLGMNYTTVKGITISPIVLYTFQRGSSMTNLGVLTAFPNVLKLGNKPVMAQGGVFLRTGDAAILYAGAMANNIHVGFSYDFTYSNLNKVNVNSAPFAGSYEISLTYYGFFSRLVPGPLTVPCTIF